VLASAAEKVPELQSVRLVALGRLEYLPASHEAHVAVDDETAPFGPNLPVAHAEPEHELAPAAEKVPGLQSLQSEAPGLSEIFPAGHDVRATFPPRSFPLGLNFPATQSGGSSQGFPVEPLLHTSGQYALEPHHDVHSLSDSQKCKYIADLNRGCAARRTTHKTQPTRRMPSAAARAAEPCVATPAATLKAAVVSVTADAALQTVDNARESASTPSQWPTGHGHSNPGLTWAT
jgi:hypothetical protein